MHRILLAAAIIVVLAYASLRAQERQWTRIYGGTSNDYGMAVLPTSDGGYLIGCHTLSFPVGTRSIYLIRTDSDGVVQWEKPIHSGTQLDFVGLHATGGGYMAVGQALRGAGSTVTYAARLDTSGNVRSEGLYGRTGTAPYHVSPTRDGGCIVVGNAGGDIYLLRLSAAGDSLWDQVYDLGQTDLGYNVVETSDGGFAVTGQTDAPPARGVDMVLLKIGATGDELWRKTLGTSNDERGQAIAETSDHGFLVAGTTWRRGYSSQLQFFLVKTDSMGTSEASAVIGTARPRDLRSMKPLGDGTLLLLGSVYAADTAGGYIARIDERGTVLWEREYRPRDSVSTFADAIAIEGGGYILTGWLHADLLLMKLSAEAPTSVRTLRGVPRRLDLW